MRVHVQPITENGTTLPGAREAALADVVPNACDRFHAQQFLRMCGWYYIGGYDDRPICRLTLLLPLTESQANAT